MESREEFVLTCMEQGVYRIVLSAPEKDSTYQKIVVLKIGSGYQCEQYTKTQVFHKNLQEEEIKEYLTGQLNGMFSQAHAWDKTWEYALRITKKGRILYNRKKAKQIKFPRFAF